MFSYREKSVQSWKGAKILRLLAFIAVFHGCAFATPQSDDNAHMHGANSSSAHRSYDQELVLYDGANQDEMRDVKANLSYANAHGQRVKLKLARLMTTTLDELLPLMGCVFYLDLSDTSMTSDDFNQLIQSPLKNHLEVLNLEAFTLSKPEDYAGITFLQSLKDLYLAYTNASFDDVRKIIHSCSCLTHIDIMRTPISFEEFKKLEIINPQLHIEFDRLRFLSNSGFKKEKGILKESSDSIGDDESQDL